METPVKAIRVEVDGGGLYKNMGQSLPLSVCYRYFHNPIANIGSFHLKSKLKKAKI